MFVPRIVLVALAVTVALVCAHTIVPTSALPTVNSGSPPKPQEITGKLGNGAHSEEPVAVGAPSADTKGAPKSAAGPPGATKTAAAAAMNAEKLKRGLTNFMNHLNPAAYFVPPKPAKPAAGSQAEPATIVNDGSSAEAVIKGPNRLVQARQLGGPLRWGRR